MCSSTRLVEIPVEKLCLRLHVRQPDARTSRHTGNAPGRTAETQNRRKEGLNQDKTARTTRPHSQGPSEIREFAVTPDNTPDSPGSGTKGSRKKRTKTGRQDGGDQPGTTQKRGLVTANGWIRRAQIPTV